MYRIRLGMGAVIALTCLAVGCTKKSASDQSLLTDIQSKLYADSTTKAASIAVDVKNGVVTLSGTVPSSDVELEAMKVANGTSGVASVNDQMKVDAAASQPPAAAPAPSSASPASPASTAATLPPSAPAPASAPPAMPAPDANATAAADASAAPRHREPASFTVPAGERLQVRMIDGIDSKKNSTGQTFRASLDAPLTRGNRVVVPAGAPVTVLLSNATSAGRVRGNNELEVQATGVTVNGQSYQVASDVVEQTGAAKGKQTAIRTGIGAAAGALIGGLAGGGKGAAIGSAAGGGAGFGYQFFTHGSQVKIPSESVLTFRLSAPLTVTR